MAEFIAALAKLLWPLVALFGIITVRDEWRARQTRQEVPEIVVPDDLMAFAMSHSEQWAQEDALRAVQQSYETWKDWNRVRAAMGIGRVD
jgi:hypothetical protein